ncbi:MAG: hypothetical protein U0528_15515 [Anaerolineae bacterium]
MTIRILIVDPDIQFTARLKPAIETAGDFVVRVCATGSAALDTLQREAQDVAVLDFEVSGMPELVDWLRAVQPGLYILLTPRNQSQAAQIAALGVQGSVTKPYFARQIVPVIIETAAARSSFEQKPKTSTQTQVQITNPSAPVMPLPDDIFLRMSGQAESETSGTTTTKRSTQAVNEFEAESAAAPAEIEEPLVPEDATIGDLVSGQPIAPSSVPELPADASSTIPDSFEAEPDEGPSVALAALKVSTDTAGIDEVSVKTVIQQVNQEALETGFTQPGTDAQQVPEWAAAEDAETPDSLNVGAERALQLTQLTVDLSASATLLTRGDLLVASAGALGQDVIADALEVIDALWQKENERAAEAPTEEAEEQANQSIIRYISVNSSDFLLFSTPTVGGMTLSMLFSPETAINVMRRQAKQLITALETVPEIELAAEEADAAVVELEAAAESEPPTTDIADSAEIEVEVEAEADAAAAPPAEVVEQPEAVSDSQKLSTTAVRAAANAATVTPTAVEAAPAPMASYGFVWLPRDQEMSLHVHALLAEWLLLIARKRGWKLEMMDGRMDCVNVQISVPQNVLPMEAVEILMQEAANRAGDPALWAEGYYIIPDARLATAQEIAEFREFQQESQQAL